MAWPFNTFGKLVSGGTSASTYLAPEAALHDKSSTSPHLPTQAKHIFPRRRVRNEITTPDTAMVGL